jgi:hypothetical protein
VLPRRAVHWLVLCFATLWFGVLVPVHNRGEISLPGAPARAGSHCCPADSPDHDPDTTPDQAPRSAGTCAVCFFIAGLDTPPPVTVAPVRLGPAGVAPAEDLPSAPAAHRALPFHSRAPPRA